MLNRTITTNLLSGILALLMTSCQPTKTMISTDKPAAEYKSDTYQPKPSIVNIPISISTKGLEKSINQSLTGLVYEDKSFDDNGGDNLKVKVWKKGEITVKAYTDAFEYYVPLKIWAQMNVGGITKQEVEGTIALRFNTTYEINENWDMATITTLTDFNWIDKPTIKVLGRKINVKAIADNLLKYNKTFLETTIDDEIKKNLNIRQHAEDTWLMLQDPINVEENYGIWLKLAPQSIVMTPLKTANGVITSTIGIQSFAEVIMSSTAPVVEKNTVLPPFKRPESIADSFAISLTSQVPYLEAEKMAKKEIVGQTFTQGKRKVTVRNLSLYGQGKDVIVGAYVEGSINGNIYLRGTPVYDIKTATIRLENVDFDLKTKSKLLKSASWLFNGAITKQIEKQLNFPLENNLEEAQQMVQKELTNYEPVKGVLVNGQLSSLSIERVIVTPVGISVVVQTNGKMQVKVDGLSF